MAREDGHHVGDDEGGGRPGDQQEGHEGHAAEEAQHRARASGPGGPDPRLPRRPAGRKRSAESGAGRGGGRAGLGYKAAGPGDRARGPRTAQGPRLWLSLWAPRGGPDTCATPGSPLAGLLPAPPAPWVSGVASEVPQARPRDRVAAAGDTHPSLPYPALPFPSSRPLCAQVQAQCGT